jgi:hypothetical protein
MKTFRILKNLAVVLLTLLLFNSCETVETTEPMGDAGQTVVKLFPDGFKLVALDAVATAQRGLAFEVRRDVHSQASLNSTVTVIVKLDDAVLTEYNTDHKTSFVPLPTSLATLDPAPAADGNITLNFGPGEFAKTIFVNVPNATKFDFSKAYGLGFRLVSTTEGAKLSEAVGTEVVSQVLVKNKYDGKYSMKGFIMRPGDTGGLEGYFKDHIKTMSTSGATAVTMSPNQLWANGGGVGGIGAWTITVDESGTPPYKITVTDPVAVNWKMDPDYPNRYDPATKTFYFKVNWGAATNPYIRGCTDTLTIVK